LESVVVRGGAQASERGACVRPNDLHVLPGISVWSTCRLPSLVPQACKPNGGYNQTKKTETNKDKNKNKQQTTNKQQASNNK
jgi:hypothetical protein